MSILSWLKRRRLDDEDFREEIRAHLAIAADERMAGGADKRSAQLASLKDFGNVTLTTEAARRVWTPWWLDAIHDQVRDVRYAIRALAKNPAFSLTVVGVLTLGIGLAQRFWGGAAKAIGKRVRAGDGDWRTVIGVAADGSTRGSTKHRARTSTCRSCSRTGRA